MPSNMKPTTKATICWLTASFVAGALAGGVGLAFGFRSLGGFTAAAVACTTRQFWCKRFAVGVPE